MANPSNTLTINIKGIDASKPAFQSLDASLTQAVQSAQKAAEAMDNVGKVHIKLSASAATAKDATSELEKAQKAAAATAVAAAAESQKAQEKAAAAAQKAAEDARIAAEKTGKAILNMAGIAGIALVGAGAASVKMAGDFQASMTELVTNAGEAESNLKMVGDGLLDLSVKTATSAKQLSEGMFNVESAGFHGAEGLKVLESAAKGAKVGHADLKTATDALTTILVDYHLPADKAAAVTNAMNAAAGSGKMELQQLAASMGSVLPLASALGISFPQVGSAISVMTNAGMDAQRASQNLANAIRSLAAPNNEAIKAMKSVGLSAQELKNTLSTQGLTGAIQLVEDHVSKTFPAGSVNSVHAFEKIMGGATGFNVALMLGGKNMESFKKNVDSITQAMNGGGDAVVGWDKVQGDFNFKLDQARMVLEALMIKLGEKLLPVLGQLLDKITPIVKGFTDWALSGHAVADVIEFIKQHAQVALPILAAVGVLVGVGLAMAFWALATAAWGAAAGVIAATWPVLLVALAVAGLTAIFVHFYQTSPQFKAFFDNLANSLKNLWSIISSNLMPVLQGLWKFLVATFGPVWTQLVNVFETQIKPSWQDLIKTFQSIMPQLQKIGVFVGGFFLGVIMIISAVIGAILGALAGILTGVAIWIGGLVKAWAGLVQMVSGLLAFLVDLLTGNFDKLGADLGIIWGGIAKMFQGVWDGITGIFVGAINGIIGLINGFAQGALGPINTVLGAMHQGTISIGLIPMIATPAASASGAVAAGYKSPALQKSAMPKTPLDNMQAMIDDAKRQADAMKAQQQSLGQLPASMPSLPPSDLGDLSSTGKATKAVDEAKKAAAAAKKQDTDDAREARLGATLQKALGDSSSDQVKALADQAKAADAAGKTSMATFYASQAASLASKDKAAATKAANKAASDAKKAATKEARDAKKAASAASHHKALVTAVQGAANQIVDAQCPEDPGNLFAMAAGVALPSYGTGTGYSAMNSPIPQNTTTSSIGDVHVHIGDDTGDADRHGRRVADAVRKELARHLRQQGVAPRYTSGGTH